MTQHVGMHILNDFLKATHETKNAGFETKDAGFATKCENPFTCIQNFSVCFTEREKVL